LIAVAEAGGQINIPVERQRGAGVYRCKSYEVDHGIIWWQKTTAFFLCECTDGNVLKSGLIKGNFSQGLLEAISQIPRLALEQE